MTAQFSVSPTVFNAALDSVVSRDRAVFNVLDYGAVADGATDCTAAVKAALVAAAAAGGGIIDFPRAGDYFFSSASTETASGLTWSIPVTTDSVEFRFVDGARCKWDGSQDLFFFSGYGKPAGMASWNSHWLGKASNHTWVAVNPVAEGDTTITCTTPADAAAFTKGKEFYIRTGNTTATTPNTEPQAEFLRVAKDGNASTGVIELEWPTYSAYAQEYFISGTSGKTSTSVTANAATFGITLCDTKVLRNVGLTNFQPYGTGTGKATRFLGVIGWWMNGVRGKAGNSLMDAIEWHDAVWRDFEFTLDTSVAVADRWLVTTATGCTKCYFENLRGKAIGSSAMYAHFHEGSGGIVGRGLRVNSVGGLAPASFSPVGIRARARVDIDDIEVVSGGSAPAIVVTDECTRGGRLTRIKRAVCTDAAKGVRTQSPGWIIQARDGSVVVVEEGAARAPQSSTQVEFLRGILRHDTSEIVLGNLPANALVIPALCQLDVRTAFNDTGTDRVTIGYDTGTNAYLVSAAALDLGTTGRKDITSAHYGGFMGIHSGTARTVKAYYVGQNADATAGKALVALAYIRVPGLT